jgi:hypothetical protein
MGQEFVCAFSKTIAANCRASLGQIMRLRGGGGVIHVPILFKIMNSVWSVKSETHHFTYRENKLRLLT